MNIEKTAHNHSGVNSFYYTHNGDLVAVADIFSTNAYIEVLPEYRRRGIATFIARDLNIASRIAGSDDGERFLKSLGETN